MQQLITIATFNHRHQGDLLRDRLKEAGIYSEVLDEGPVQKLWFFAAEPKAHIRVRVKKEDHGLAEKQLEEWLASGDPGVTDAVRCPECGSSRIEYPQFSRRTGLSGVFALFAALGLFQRQYFCENCKFTWSEIPEKKPDLDVLNWPKKS